VHRPTQKRQRVDARRHGTLLRLQPRPAAAAGRALTLPALRAAARAHLRHLVHRAAAAHCLIYSGGGAVVAAAGAGGAVWLSPRHQPHAIRRHFLPY
nr:hypothetical protein [Tanacetum cinerariifolium]